MAIYVSNSSKFPKKFWLRHTLTPPHAEPMDRFWQNKRLSYSKFNLPNLHGSFMQLGPLSKKLWNKTSRGGRNPPPPPCSFFCITFFLFEIITQTKRLNSSFGFAQLLTKKFFQKIDPKLTPGGVKNKKIFTQKFFEQKLFRIVWNEFWYSRQNFENFDPGGQFGVKFWPQRVNFFKISNFGTKHYSIQIWSDLKQ